ncbi:ribosomal protein S17A [Hanseniaspora vineae]
METPNLSTGASKALIEKYYPKLTMDFQVNKRLCDDIAVIQSKRLRNKIAGYTTHLMKRIQKGPVRGISFKLQEEERERKDQYVPEVSALDLSRSNGVLNVDKQTADMVKSLGLKLPLAVSDVSAVRDRRYRKRV